MFISKRIHIYKEDFKCLKNFNELLMYSYTVNVVIFAGGKFSENGRQTLHVGVIFAMPERFT